MKEYMLERCMQMGIAVTPEQADRFIAYHTMLMEANRFLNLTRVSTDESEACDRNYLDSLTLANHLAEANCLIDIGSGAGFPGIPIAIIRPDIRIVMLDSQKKRVEFLNSAVKSLELNAQAYHMRSEEAAKLTLHREAYDIACARAVADMTVLSELLLPFVKVGGRMLALKGPNSLEETRNAAYAIAQLGGGDVHIYDACIPGRDWEHKIIEVKKLSKTPAKFPRKAGIAEKRPLNKGGTDK